MLKKGLAGLLLVCLATVVNAQGFGPAVTINGVEIPRSKVQAQADHLINQRGIGSGGITQPSAYRKIQEEVIEQIVVQELLWQDAQRRGTVVGDEKVEQEVAKPDLVIYMQASIPTLIERITKRARDYEADIDPAYLERLSEAYSYFFFHYRETPLLVVNTDDIDFVKNPADLDALVQQIIRCRRGTQVYVPLGSSQTDP